MDPFDIQDEVNSYLTAPIAYKNTNILDWWQLNATQFPNLAIASQAILAIVGSLGENLAETEQDRKYK
ncbi:hypothetical protein CROQUDRAFT_98900 [Cronartium quercuum f. sp. fusiforme G11]|uniref:HAT C-terminal dimerisation domain-containing protein n=1 Tax=Cronartium quercuum f. sp. fusiforme G11 TaxID=708437 RepID=A0A9P6N7Y8_9BASI|nr:hypothetical protein CROQUDRAFT_98900 [Cronartium quercuum f. sp. fusiforme G11]